MRPQLSLSHAYHPPVTHLSPTRDRQLPELAVLTGC